MGKRKSRKRKRKNTRKMRNVKKRNKKTKKIRKNKERCSPKKKSQVLDYTCYSKESLFKIRKLWNTKHPDSAIKSNSPKKIWESLHYILGKTCKKESCWLRHKCLKANVDLSILKEDFSPKAPEEWKKNPQEWLTSIEILEFMKQYEKTYENFEFLGPSPIDYDTHKAYGECVWEELCEFSLRDNLKEGKTKVGIIFNTDPHTEDGEHWVAMFMDLDKGKLYYFDSYGEEIPEQIDKFADNVIKQANSMGRNNFKKYISKKRHQFSESECGMYCLYFIIEMLKGKSFSKFNGKKKIKDKHMIKLRKLWFNH